MKKTSKAAQLRLVRNIVRNLTPAQLGDVAGGLGCSNVTDPKNDCQSGASHCGGNTGFM